MKQAINNIKLATVALTVFFSFGFKQSISASSPIKIPATTEIPIELKIADSIYGHPVFRLKIENAEDNEFYVKVLNAEGSELYHEVLKGKNISRRYMMNLEEVDLNNIRFEITNLSTHATQAYNIKHNTSVVENLEIAKL